jgi:histidinol-phosphatase (PHP family)
MERTCARAAAIGLPAVAFTEHADYTAWFSSAVGEYPELAPFATPDGIVRPPRFDAPAYLDCLERCRAAFPTLRIISGVEFGEPHWHAEAVATLVDSGRFERVLASVHSLPNGRRFSEPEELFLHRSPDEVMHEYLAEAARMIASCDTFSVLAHIDYPVRVWPRNSEPFNPREFEEAIRHVLRTLAGTDRVLEVNTRVPLDELIVDWWRDEGGHAVTFGSDAHEPTSLAAGFQEAVSMVEAAGFRRGQHPYDVWRR